MDLEQNISHDMATVTGQNCICFTLLMNIDSFIMTEKKALPRKLVTYVPCHGRHVVWYATFFKKKNNSLEKSGGIPEGCIIGFERDSPDGKKNKTGQTRSK